MDTLTLCNLKGGAGKTTSAVCIADEVASRGHPTLLIDWDPQGTLSGWIAERGGYATMLARGELAEVHRCSTRTAEGARVDLVAANRSLATANDLKAARLARHLEKFLDAASDGYEVALVDVQPSVGPIVLGALMATGRALVPVEAGVGALQGHDRRGFRGPGGRPPDARQEDSPSHSRAVWGSRRRRGRDKGANTRSGGHSGGAGSLGVATGILPRGKSGS